MGSRTGVGAGELAKVLVKNIDVIAGPLVSLAYPLYASIREIENKSPNADDQQWLTYWIMYSMITLFELTFASFLDWVPVWPYIKLIAFVWLVMPQFRGAAYLYESFVRPLYVNPHAVHVWYVPKKNDRPGKREDIIVAANKYMREHGSGDRGLIHRAEKNEQYRNLNYIDPDPIYGSSGEVYQEEPSYYTKIMFTKMTWDQVTEATLTFLTVTRPGPATTSSMATTMCTESHPPEH